MFDMWGKTDLFLFTSNPIVNSRGLAVMGRGIAKQIADKYPQVQREFGDYLKFPGPDFSCDRLCIVDNQLVGFFMVKDHWRSPARLDIISDSVDELGAMASAYDRIDLNFPGIGNGKLTREAVLPIIQFLPDNVHVWEYGDELQNNR
jgi:hypothetical protein